MKAYKKFSTAKKNNPTNGPILKAGDFYIVGVKFFSEVALIDPETNVVESHIGIHKLQKMGNGNWATPDYRGKKEPKIFF